MKDTMKARLPKLPFTLKQVMYLGITRYMITKLMEKGEVEKVGYGLYQQVQKSEHPEYHTLKFVQISARTKGDACICLWSALDYYDLTEEFIERVWIYIPYTKKITSPEARAVRKRSLDWSTGVISHKGFNITSIERTLVDCFLSPRHVGLKDAINCTRKAMIDNKTSLEKIIDVATKMGVYKRLRRHLELAV